MSNLIPALLVVFVCLPASFMLTALIGMTRVGKYVGLPQKGMLNYRQYTRMLLGRRVEGLSETDWVLFEDLMTRVAQGTLKPFDKLGPDLTPPRRYETWEEEEPASSGYAIMKPQKHLSIKLGWKLYVTMVATLGTLLILAWYMNFMSQSKLENIGTLTEVAAQMPTGSPWTAVNGTTLESVIAPSGIGVTSNKARNLGFTVICPARGVPGAGAVPADTLKNTAPVTGGRSITPGAQAATGKMSSADPGYYSQCTGTLGNYRLTYRAGNTDAQWIAVLKTLGTDTPATSQ